MSRGQPDNVDFLHLEKLLLNLWHFPCMIFLARFAVTSGKGN